MLRRKTQLVPISVIKTIAANAMFVRGDKAIGADRTVDDPCLRDYCICAN
ncbi:MAG: hypothetical protein JW759_10455 [Candidatus Coatesbacteria bacterium]|nr:hypothetical protein [Candidatus Coatesbacteria bacterium]